jgi:alpha-tubulin suppressor-like RCC1 family protein
MAAAVLIGLIAGITATAVRPSPAAAFTGAWQQISAGGDHTCGIQTDGGLWCWGRNDHGQLGLGGRAHRFVPTQVRPDSRWSDVAASHRHTCAVRVDTTLWCWGSNSVGQLGLSDRRDRWSPTVVGTGWRSVASSYLHTCGIRIEGTLWCWGGNDHDELGLGPAATGVDRLWPQQVTPATIWAEVTTGFAHTCARWTSGVLWCWGRGDHGALGRGTEDRFYPTQVDDAIWSAVTSGADHTCGLRGRPGTLWCWGRGALGRLGVGGGANLSVPTQVGTAATWRNVSAVDSHTCGSIGDAVRCWGWNAFGQIGIGSTINQLVPVPVQPATRWSVVAAGMAHTCAIRVDGGLSCWGKNSTGQLGIATGTESEPEPRRVLDRPAWMIAATGYASHHTCAVRTDGTAWCWGLNDRGQLGYSTFISFGVVPRQVGPLTTWGSVAVGQQHTCGVHIDRTLWCWGANDNGQLGLGTRTDAPTPTRVAVPAGFAGWIAVTAGGSSTCAVAERPASALSTLFCWGDNEHHQVGDGTTTDRLVPTAVYASGFDGISAGNVHACASAAGGGYLYCWGNGRYGQLGLGATGAAARPMRVTTGFWRGATAGAFHTCGVADGGTLACWGHNGRGQLGLGDTVDRNVATAVGPANDWGVVGTGGTHTCGIRAGSVFCWGGNSFAQLGLGFHTDVRAPETATLTAAAAVTAGGQHTCALRSEGSLWCWGRGDSGQLGVGPDAPVSQLTPRLVPLL